MKKLKQKFEKINIENIILDENNPRIDKTVDIEKLAANIKEIGLLNPIIVKPFGNKYKLVDGERRLRALKSLKQDTINCIVFEDKRDNLFCQVSICLNNENLPVFPDKARAIYNLFKKTGMNSEELGEKLGCDASYLRRLNKFWINLGVGVDKEKLTKLEAIIARIISKFSYLTPEEKLELGKEIKQLKEKKLITFTSIKKLIPYFKYIKEEDQKNIPKYGFQTAVEWAKEIKQKQDKTKYVGMNYNILCKVLSNQVTHSEWLLESIKSNNDLKDYQMTTLKFMLMPLFLKLKQLLKEK